MNNHESRLRFIRTLHGMPALDQKHLLSIESDEELRALKEVALQEQWFEVAAAIAKDIKRRTTERCCQYECPGPRADHCPVTGNIHCP
jgi:hypothetical protein